MAADGVSLWSRVVTRQTLSSHAWLSNAKNWLTGKLSDELPRPPIHRLDGPVDHIRIATNPILMVGSRRTLWFTPFTEVLRALDGRDEL